MFIFRRSLAGPLAALTLLAVLVVTDALFDISSTAVGRVSVAAHNPLKLTNIGRLL